MKHIEKLIADAGEITLGALSSFACIATSADESNTLVMLVRRASETLLALLKRLDQAIARAYDNDGFTDEVNSFHF